MNIPKPNGFVGVNSESFPKLVLGRNKVDPFKSSLLSSDTLSDLDMLSVSVLPSNLINCNNYYYYYYKVMNICHSIKAKILILIYSLPHSLFPKPIRTHK